MERTKIGLLLAKQEVTYALDPVPSAAANAIPVIRNQMSFAPEFDPIRREILEYSYGRVAGENALPRVKVSFSVEVRGNRTDGAAADISSGNSAQAIELDALLQACDLNSAYTAETSGGARDGYVIYKPYIAADQGKSVTLYFYTATKLHKITGCKGTVKGTFEAGRFGILNFEFMGLYVAPIDSAVPVPTVKDTKPPLFVLSGTTIDAWNPNFKKVEFDLGNQVFRRDDANATDGVRGFLVTDRQSTITVNPESVPEATHAVWAGLKAGTVKTMTTKVGSASGNRMDLITTIQKRQVGYEDDGGNRITPWQADVVRSALSTGYGNEFQLKFY